MANPEHVEIVRQGQEAINAWREAHPGESFDLCEANLNGATLQGATLYRATLGCRMFLSCISKGFGGFCAWLLRL